MIGPKGGESALSVAIRFFVIYGATNGSNAMCRACFKAKVTMRWCFGQVPVLACDKILACGDIKRRRV